MTIQQVKNTLWDWGFRSNQDGKEFKKGNKFFWIKHEEQLKFSISSMQVHNVFDNVDNLILLAFLTFNEKNPYDFEEYCKKIKDVING